MKINYSKIWREIGNAFATPYGERTKEQIQLTSLGLCSAICDKLSYHSQQDLSKIGEDMGLRGYWWDYNRVGILGMKTNFPDSVDLERATFAYFMADIGNKEYEKLIKAVTP